MSECPILDIKVIPEGQLVSLDTAAEYTVIDKAFINEEG